jgi:hypothetical protein
MKYRDEEDEKRAAVPARPANARAKRRRGGAVAARIYGKWRDLNA